MRKIDFSVHDRFYGQRYHLIPICIFGIASSQGLCPCGEIAYSLLLLGICSDGIAFGVLLEENPCYGQKAYHIAIGMEMGFEVLGIYNSRMKNRKKKAA